MRKRILTAVIGIPFTIFCLVVRGWFAELVIAVLAETAMIECYRALRACKYNVFPWGGYIAPIVMWILARMGVVLDPLILVAGAMGLTLSGVLLGKNPTFPDAAASVYPLFTALLPIEMCMLMLNKTYGRVPGVALVTMAIAIAFAGDAAAFFGGKIFGKHKLCPLISPHKTVEGALFYFLGSTIIALIVRFFFIIVFHWAMPGIPAAIALGIIGGFAGQVGDLAASLLKRHSGIKDFGHIFPGHGGVMDRFDSVIFTLIVLYCYTLLLI